MKVKVLKRFRDKYNLDRIYEKDEIIEVSKERFEEILTVDQLVEAVVEEEAEAAEEKKPAKRTRKTTKKESE